MNGETTSRVLQNILHAFAFSDGLTIVESHLDVESARVLAPPHR